MEEVENIFSLIFWSAVLGTAIRAGTPLLFASLGEIITERSGVLNLGIEGMMAVGALVGFAGTYYSGSPWLGLLLAMIAGGIMALIHGFISITLLANQAVSGIMLVMLGIGLAYFFGAPMIGKTVVGFKPIPIPVLKDIPLLGPALFQQNILVYLSILLVPVIYIILFRTHFGLNITAVGESPQTVDSLGVRVYLVRYVCVIAGGMLAGISGAYLSLAYTPMWIEGMTAGRGWIAVAIVIFASWRPWRAIAGSYLLGGLEVLHLRLQVSGVKISPYFLTMLPYITTIIILILVAGKTRKKRAKGSPTALGIPYARGE